LREGNWQPMANSRWVMTANTNLFNDIIIEELEQRIAPSGLASGLCLKEVTTAEGDRYERNLRCHWV